MHVTVIVLTRPSSTAYLGYCANMEAGC